MQKISLTIRVDAEDLEKWKRYSKGNLSEWIRARLNTNEQPENKPREAVKKDPKPNQPEKLDWYCYEHGVAKSDCVRCQRGEK